MEKTNEFLSLFDYLGAAAGGELGKAVSEASKKAGQEIKMRDVVTNKYQGKVILYKREFLENYFHPKPPKPILNSQGTDDDLPF